jgi:hypothetical protein
MAWTYATLSQAIQDYLETDEETLATNLPVIVQQAEDRILKTVQLPAFRRNVTGAMTSGDQYLGAPDDFLSAYSLALNDSGYEYLLLKDVSFIREAFPNVATIGTPRYYSIFEETFFLIGPTPDQNYDIELHYFYKPESIVTASTSWLGDNAVSTLLYGCLVEAGTFQYGDGDMMQTYAARYEDALQKLRLLGEGRSAVDSYRSG